MIIAWSEPTTKQEHHWRWTPWGARWLEAWPKTYRSETWLPKNMEMLRGIHKIIFFWMIVSKDVLVFYYVLRDLGVKNPNLNLRIVVQTFFFQTNRSLNHLSYFPSADLWVMFRQESLNYQFLGESNFMQTYRQFLGISPFQIRAWSFGLVLHHHEPPVLLSFNGGLLFVSFLPGHTCEAKELGLGFSVCGRMESSVTGQTKRREGRSF